MDNLKTPHGAWMRLRYKKKDTPLDYKVRLTMKFEKVEWSSYHLPFEGLIEAWIVADDMAAVLAAVIKVKSATQEDLDKLEGSLKK